jgi:hypothetical protein
LQAAVSKVNIHIRHCRGQKVRVIHGEIAVKVAVRSDPAAHILCSLHCAAVYFCDVIIATDEGLEHAHILNIK